MKLRGYARWFESLFGLHVSDNQERIQSENIALQKQRTIA